MATQNFATVSTCMEKVSSSSAKQAFNSSAAWQRKVDF